MSWSYTGGGNAAGDWVRAEFPIPGAEEKTRIRSHREYVNVHLKYAHLANLRKGLKRFYGVVHSTTRVPRVGDPDFYEFTKMINPTGLRGQNAKGYNNLIALNQRLIGPVPYRGGEIAIDAGLYSVEAASLLEPYLRLAESLSQTAAGMFSGPAALLAEPLRQAFLGLIGDKGDMLEIGLVDSFPAPYQCRILVMPPSQNSDAGPYTVREDGHVLTADNRVVLDRSYLVLDITATEHHGHWSSVPGLSAAYMKIAEVLQQKGHGPEYDEELRRFRFTVESSDDLTASDAAQICKEVERRFRGIEPPRSGRQIRGWRGNGIQIPELSELDPFGLGAADTGSDGDSVAES